MARVLLHGRNIVRELLIERPKFHGESTAGSKNFALDDTVLFWLVDNVPPGARTLETGCGYSTVALATKSERHLVVSPFSGEHGLICAWCLEHGVPTDHLEFIAEPSQRVLPALGADAFDLVLIDGDHAFPAPFIDWYYVAEKVKPSGFVVVDDTNLVTGKILRDFLAVEQGRWRLEYEIGKTAVFRRISSSPIVEGFNWTHQPYVKDLTSLPKRGAWHVERAVKALLPTSVKEAIRKLRYRI